MGLGGAEGLGTISFVCSLYVRITVLGQINTMVFN
jgi:hypothetical protein